MSDVTEPTPTPLEDLGKEAAATVLPDVVDPVLDVRQGYIVAVDAATNTYTFRFPETSTDVTLGPAHSILPCMAGDTVWVLTRGGMNLILGPQDAGGVPPGAAMVWFTATAPDGWVIANGGSTAAYPRLAALFGGTLPDMRGRLPIGTDGSYALAGGNHLATHTHPAVSAITGSASVGVTGNQSANHNHGTFAAGGSGPTGVSADHTHTIGHDHSIAHQHAAATTSIAVRGVNFIIKW